MQKPPTVIQLLSFEGFAFCFHPSLMRSSSSYSWIWERKIFKTMTEHIKQVYLKKKITSALLNLKMSSDYLNVPRSTASFFFTCISKPQLSAQSETERKLTGEKYFSFNILFVCLFFLFLELLLGICMTSSVPLSISWQSVTDCLYLSFYYYLFNCVVLPRQDYLDIMATGVVETWW